MANAKATVALNIGSQRISMAVFQSSKAGELTLEKYDSASILADPAVEMARLPQIRVAISELADKLKISKSKKLSYAISGQSVFTRFIKLPLIEDDNIEQLVAFEAQQHVPFPIDEVIWDWQLLESGSGEKEVALVAIKGESLNEINDVVFDTGIGTSEVDAAPTALYNALKYNYPELEETVLLIDIGAKTCNLIYMEGSRMFTRSVAVGGASITTAISKEYGINFSEAESQKCSNGVVALNTTHTSEMDEVTAALATVIRNALTKLPAEIARTTNYFRSQHSGNAPTKILLAGGGANLPHIADFFQDKLRLPVEFFNPMRRVSVGKDVDVERITAEAHMLGELVGLALRGVNQASLKIDLVPEMVFRERQIQRRKPWLVGASGILLAGLAVWAWSNMSRKADAETQVEEITNKVNQLTLYSKPLEALAKREVELDAVARQLISAQQARVLWVDLWDDLARQFASDAVWLVDFDPVVGFNPDEATAGSAGTAQSVITSDFARNPYGESALAKLTVSQPAAPAPRGRGKAVAAEPPSQMINAFRVKGFWRGKDGHKEVRELIDRLRSSSNYFAVMPTEKTIISLPTKLDDGAYATPFDLILPLKKAVPVPPGGSGKR